MKGAISVLLLIAISSNCFIADDIEDKELLNYLYSQSNNLRNEELKAKEDFYTEPESNPPPTYNNLDTSLSNLPFNEREDRHAMDFLHCSRSKQMVSFAHLYGDTYEYFPSMFTNTTCEESVGPTNPFRSSHHYQNYDRRCYVRKARSNCKTLVKKQYFLRRKMNSNCWEKHLEPVAIGCDCDVIFVYN